jgi:hypothetical protein
MGCHMQKWLDGVPLFSIKIKNEVYERGLLDSEIELPEQGIKQLSTKSNGLDVRRCNSAAFSSFVFELQITCPLERAEVSLFQMS